MEKRGLTNLEAGSLFQKYGANEITEIGIASPLKILLRQVRKNFIVYLLFIAVVISFLVGKTVTAYAISGVILILITVGFIQEFRAERAIKALKGMLMPVSIVIRNGKEKEIPSREIVPGDMLVLRTGEKIPADCVLLEEKDLLVNESILTGESREIKKIVPKNTNQYQDINLIFMGSFIINGKAIAKVLHTGMNTKFGSIAGLISTAEKNLPLQDKVNKISKYMAFIAIIFASITGALMVLMKPASDNLIIDALILTIALAVSAFPEGFPVVLITTLASGAHRMAKKNAIVNRMSIIETLGETTVICSDKTGTITKGEMTVKKIYSDNSLIEVSGAGYEGTGEFLIRNKKVDFTQNNVYNLLIKSSLLCNDAKIERTGEDNIYRIIGTPTEASLLIMAAKTGLHKEDLSFKRIEEISFNSERKMMSVLCRLEDKNYVFSKGAIEILLKKCKYIQRKTGIHILTEREKNRILSVNKDLTSDTLRTLALAYKEVNSVDKEHLEEKLVFLGLVGIEDPPREEIKESIKLCSLAGIKVKMLTGDNRETALSIAKKIGISGKVLDGDDLDRMTEDELSKVVNEISLFIRVRPEHKIKIVKALKINGEIVLMTGDGVNDAPALKEAHIGVAMGKNGTDVSRASADLILKDDNFSTIVEAIREGRTIFKNIRKFISYQLSCNYAELSILFFGVLLSPFLGWQIPLLLALQILFMNLVTDDLPALTLSMTPQSADIMEEKPRKKKEILNKSLILWFCIAGISMAVITLAVFTFLFNVFNQGFEQARTTALVTLILLEIANAYNFMSFRKEVIISSLWANKYLLGASILSLILTIFIIYTPLNKVFETAPIALINWLIAILASLMIFFIFNLLKRINNKKKMFNIEHF